MDRHALLAIDTSTEICSVAVCFAFPATGHAPLAAAGALSVVHGVSTTSYPELGAEPGLVAEASTLDDPVAGLRFITIERSTGSVSSGFILPAIDAVLTAAGMRLQDCGALAFGAGPGSFTGLRTATGIAQGLAFGANLQVLPVNTLMACAESARQRDALKGCSRVLAVMDARMSQCYWEVFDGSAGDGSWRSLGASAVSDPQAIIVPLSADGQATQVTGTSVPVSSRDYAVVGNGPGVFGDQIRAVEDARCLDTGARPSAAAIAAIGWRDWQAGRAVTPAEALPRYVRDKVASTTLEREAEREARAARAVSAQEGKP
jgi:tRNA threonylcarbamoyladenosine biosynthesis protein TsaB